MAAARDRVLVLNELWLNPEGQTPSAVVVPNAGYSPFTPVPSTPTVMEFPINGVHQPDIDIRPGETQRWRVLAAGPHRFSIWKSRATHSTRSHRMASHSPMPDQ